MKAAMTAYPRDSDSRLICVMRFSSGLNCFSNCSQTSQVPCRLPEIASLNCEWSGYLNRLGLMANTAMAPGTKSRKVKIENKEFDSVRSASSASSTPMDPMIIAARF